MSHQHSRYFTLDINSLRALAAWSADCAERALPVFVTLVPSDSRPRDAIAGARSFAGGGKRTAKLRTLAMAALSAAREADDPAAAAAARAAGLAASSAYTHPLADVEQTKHVLGSAAYAALALELAGGNDPEAAESEVRWAISHIPPEARDILMHMPPRDPGRSHLDHLLYELDSLIRASQL